MVSPMRIARSIDSSTHGPAMTSKGCAPPTEMVLSGPSGPMIVVVQFMVRKEYRPLTQDATRARRYASTGRVSTDDWSPIQGTGRLLWRMTKNGGMLQSSSVHRSPPPGRLQRVTHHGVHASTTGSVRR